MATLLGLLFMAQKNCDLCIAVSSDKVVEPVHHPVQAPEMSLGSHACTSAARLSLSYERIPASVPLLGTTGFVTVFTNTQ